MADAATRGIRSAQTGLLVNTALAIVKFVAGVVGTSYALIADAVESMADVFSSFIVWMGLRVAARPADDDHPYGHGRAETLAAAIVSLMLLAAAAGIGIEATREILKPHRPPAVWTLAVLGAVMLIKATLSRRVHAVGTDIRSAAVQADARHHLSDAITSAAAFIGISVAIVGSRVWGGRSWAAADDWAALLAAAVIAYNGVTMLLPALHELMDRMPSEVVAPVRRAAEEVPGVLAIEKLAVRKSGMVYRVTVHVQAAPSMPLDEAHALGGRVKRAIQAAVPEVQSVLVHMEPFEHGSRGAESSPELGAEQRGARVS